MTDADDEARPESARGAPPAEPSSPSSPSSPASASALRGPSEEAVALELRAAAAEEDAEEAGERRARDEATAKAKAESERAAARVDAARAPNGFFRSTRFFFLAAAAVVQVAFAFAALTERHTLVPPPAMAVAAGVWLVLFSSAWADAARWRKRLPFALEGFDVIAGDGDVPKYRGAVVALRVRLVMPRASAAAKTARHHALEILSARINAELRKDKDLDDLKEWKIDGDACAGEMSLAVYTTRMLEKWLRREVRLLARVHRVDKVVFDARYSTKTIWLPVD